MDLARALLTLSEHDLGIVRAEKQLEEIPEKLAILELRKRIREFEVIRGRAQAYVDEAGRLLKRDEDEIAGLTGKIETEQAKVLSGDVTNPKELQNITREMDALGRRKDKLENASIGLMEKLESGQAQVAKVDEAIEKAHDKEAQLIGAFQRKGGALQREIATMKSRRDALAHALPSDLLNRYEHARDTKHGIAVGRLEGDVCSACRVELPSERVQALEAGPEIATCPNCKRLLVVRFSEAGQ